MIFDSYAITGFGTSVTLGVSVGTGDAVTLGVSVGTGDAVTVGVSVLTNRRLSVGLGAVIIVINDSTPFIKFVVFCYFGTQITVFDCETERIRF